MSCDNIRRGRAALALLMNAIAKRILRQRRRAAGLDGRDGPWPPPPPPAEDRTECDGRRTGPIDGRLSPIDDDDVWRWNSGMLGSRPRDAAASHHTNIIIIIIIIIII